MLQLVLSSYGSRDDEVLKREFLELPLSQTRVLDLVVDDSGVRIRSVGIVPSTTSIPPVVKVLKMLEAFCLGVVKIGSVGDKTRRR